MDKNIIIAISCFGGYIIWYILGCAVLAAIDMNMNGDLLKWVKSSPQPKGLYSFLVVMLFPIIWGYYLYQKIKYKKES